jgi:hypothetical protein
MLGVWDLSTDTLLGEVALASYSFSFVSSLLYSPTLTSTPIASMSIVLSYWLKMRKGGGGGG